MGSVQHVWKTFLGELKRLHPSQPQFPRCFHVCSMYIPTPKVFSEHSFFIFGVKDIDMSANIQTHKENSLLTRGIFSSSDFDAFQKSEVSSIVDNIMDRNYDR